MDESRRTGMMISGDPALSAWHAVRTDHALLILQSRPEGIGEGEAAVRRSALGANVLPAPAGTHPLRLLGRQVHNPLIYVLLGSAGLAFAMGRWIDAAVVLGVVAANAVIGFLQELKAGRAIQSLSKMLPRLACVLREGERATVDAADLVPGDVVLIQSGDRVPADLRLLDCRGAAVNESMLTGESVPASKARETLPESTPLAERANMAYMGTFMAAGTATGLVVATGPATELGRISAMVGAADSIETPLTRKMEKVARVLTVVIVAIALLLLGVGLARGYGLLDAALAAITMAVAAIPEGLPAVITIALAIGVHRMAGREAVIRHLPAVETLGSATCICTDKTGTLTRNEMTVTALWTPQTGLLELTGTGYSPEGRFLRQGQAVDVLGEDVWPLLHAGVLCSDATIRLQEGRWSIQGDPTEGALVVAAAKAKLHEASIRAQWPRLDAIPFESERRFMATLHEVRHEQRMVLIKGAPEAILPRCRLSDATGQAVTQALGDLAGRGLRVLALAERGRMNSAQPLGEQDVREGFSLLGLQGMIDPPREEACQAIRQCRQAGIRVNMVTGDHPATAAAIARQLGLDSQGEAVTGTEMDLLDDEPLRLRAAQAVVFARVSPENKIRLVRLLQGQGHVVAMTGDGVNDAPALKQADIGVAMGRGGTEVAREASDMVLADDNFASIVAAVEEGRRVYDNLVKAFSFILPTNLGEGLLVVLAVAFFPMVGGVPLMPILPVQILWINLVATVALALPLAFEAREPGLMRRPPRPPGASILSPFVLIRTAMVALLMTAGAVGLFLLELFTHPMLHVDVARAVADAQTLTVTSVILFQALYLLNCRSLQDSIRHVGLLTNRTVFWGIGVILALQMLFVYWRPMNTLFDSTPLSALAWVKAASVAAAGAMVVALEKGFWRWFSRRHPDRAGRMGLALARDETDTTQ